jgi:ArsR family transcriptional regulator
LRRAGLVVARKEGMWVHYSLAPAQAPFHQKLLECLGCCFGAVPEIRADATAAGKLKEQGGCCPR